MNDIKFGDMIETPSGPAIVKTPPVLNVSNGHAMILDSGIDYFMSHANNSRTNWVMLDRDEAAIRANALDLSHGLPTRSGTDPEVFVADSTGKVIPAWRYLPHESAASKEPLAGRWMRVYWDGWQAEMSHIQREGAYHRNCHEELAEDVRAGLWGVLRAARAYDPGAKLMIQDVVEVAQEDLEREEDGHVLLGCAPSLNAYPDVEPIQGVNGRLLPIRFAGCHIHVSVNNFPRPAWFPHGTVVMMDKLAGLMMTALGRDLEDWRRRQFYGRPGEFRAPVSSASSPRLEYRTPGSFLLRHPAAFHFGMDMTRAAMRWGMLEDGRALALPDVKDIITQCDADTAWRVIDAHRDVFAKLLGVAYPLAGHSTLASMFNMLEHGLVSRVPVDDTEANWELAKVGPEGQPNMHNRHWLAISLKGGA